MPITVKHEPPAATVAGAAYLGGLGQYQKYLDSRRFAQAQLQQRDRMQLRDLAQRQYQSAQDAQLRQQGIQARFEEAERGRDFQFGRDQDNQEFIQQRDEQVQAARKSIVDQQIEGRLGADAVRLNAQGQQIRQRQLAAEQAARKYAQEMGLSEEATAALMLQVETDANLADWESFVDRPSTPEERRERFDERTVEHPYGIWVENAKGEYKLTEDPNIAQAAEQRKSIYTRAQKIMSDSAGQSDPDGEPKTPLEFSAALKLSQEEQAVMDRAFGGEGEPDSEAPTVRDVEIDEYGYYHPKTMQEALLVPPGELFYDDKGMLRKRK